MELSYVSGNINPKKLLIFQEVTFPAQKIKKTTLKKLLKCSKIELFSPKKLNKPCKIFLAPPFQKKNT